jgi:hypothetical protein
MAVPGGSVPVTCSIHAFGSIDHTASPDAAAIA